MDFLFFMNFSFLIFPLFFYFFYFINFEEKNSFKSHVNVCFFTSGNDLLWK